MRLLSYSLLLLLMGGCTSAAEKLATQANTQAASGQSLQAIHALRQALKEEPEDPTLLNALDRIGTPWMNQQLPALQEKAADPSHPLLPRTEAALEELRNARKTFDTPRARALDQALEKSRDEARQRQNLCLSLAKSPPSPETLLPARQEVARCRQEDPRQESALAPLETSLRQQWVEILLTQARRATAEKRESEAVALLDQLLAEQPDHADALSMRETLRGKITLRERVKAIAFLLEQGDSVAALQGWRNLDRTPGAQEEALALEMDQLATRLGGTLLEQARNSFAKRRLGSAVRALAGAVELSPSLRLRPESVKILAALESRSTHYLEQELPGNALFARWLAEKIQEGRGGVMLSELQRRLEREVASTLVILPMEAVLGLEKSAGEMEGELRQRVMAKLTRDILPAPKEKGEAVQRLLRFDASGMGETESAVEAGRSLGMGWVLLSRLEEHQVQGMRAMEQKPVKVESGRRPVPNPAYAAFQKEHEADWKKLEEAGKAPPPTVEEPEYRTVVVETGEVTKSAAVRMHLRLVGVARGEALFSRVFEGRKEAKDHASKGAPEVGIAPDPEDLPTDEALLAAARNQMLESVADGVLMTLGAREQERVNAADSLLQHGEGYAAMEKLVEAWTLARMKKLDPLPYQTRLEELAEKVW